VYFTVVTFLIAGIAYYFTHDTMRVLAVLVVATPCPLILATPIAIISGISRCARAGVIVKSGGALEILAQAKTFIFDKTGTVTLGVPEVERVDTFDNGTDDVLLRSASLDQCSTHILARALVGHTAKSGIALSYPEKCTEHFGEGIEGVLDGTMYRFGSIKFLERSGSNITDLIRVHHEDAQNLGTISVYLSRENQIVGAIIFADKIRSDASKFFDGLRADGVKRIMLLTGDKKAVANKIGGELRISEIVAECLPEDKVKNVNNIVKSDRPVVMVGDGVNDAPALASSDVGIALGTGGETASSEAAHIVIVSGSLERVGLAYKIAKRTLLVARQGILLGIGLSVVAMIFGATGGLPPLQGALLQEGIDVLVILNALRVAR
jgi:heavy metal translocating P-type ATPase